MRNDDWIENAINSLVIQGYIVKIRKSAPSQPARVDIRREGELPVAHVYHENWQEALWEAKSKL